MSYGQRRLAQALSPASAPVSHREKVPIRFLEVALDEAIHVAALHMIYAYDAYFLVCARNQSSALITLDGGLQTAARAAHISLVEITP